MADGSSNARLETFCDGVFAIAMTLLIIDIKLPSTETITTAAGLWSALRQMAPSILAFILSFTVIFITWVNHHGFMRLVHRSSAPFIFANGLLLLTVVIVPFPTALLGEFLLTDHAAPAVVVYNAVLAVQAVAWILLAGAALGGRLTNDEPSAATIRDSRKRGYFAVILYSLLAVGAFWFPFPMAVVTMLSWTIWLVLSVTIRHS